MKHSKLQHAAYGGAVGHGLYALATHFGRGLL